MADKDAIGKAMPSQLGEGDTYRPKAQRTPKEFDNGTERSKLGFWVDKRVHKQLLELALEHNTNQSELLHAAMDLLFVKVGRPTIAELTGKKGVK